MSSVAGTSGSIVGRHTGTSVGGASGPSVETIDTPFYRLHTPAELAVLVLTLPSHGCPTQAIVAAFGLDERTVARWLAGAGAHCQRVHEQLVEQGQVDLRHVQADELWVKQVGGKVWMALALAVPTRLWPGGVISGSRDLPLITRLVQRARACAATPAILVCVDGLASYVTAFLQVFRQPVYTGRRGRPRLVLPDGSQFAQVIKHSAKRRVVGVTRRVLHGTLAGIEAALTATATGTVIDTAYIERLNATFRAPSRRSPDGAGRSLAPRPPSPPACGSSAPPTTSAGPTTACASALPTTRRTSGSVAPRPWRPGSPTTAGPWTSSSASRSPYLAGTLPTDAAGRPNTCTLAQRHDHASVGCYLENA